MNEESDSDRLYRLMSDLEAQEDIQKEEYIRAPFSYPGSKYKSLGKILPRLPLRKTFVLPCGGSGVELLNRRESILEVFNDRYAGVVAFYRCIRNKHQMEQLVKRLQLILHSREEFIWCRDTWESCTDDVERAARWYYMIRTSFSQIGRNWGRATHGAPQQATVIAKSLKAFPDFHRRFANVQIENLDAIECIQDYDSFDTVFYIDPDYIDTDAGLYKHTVDHKRLLKQIGMTKGFVAITNYENKLYDSQTYWTDRISWKVPVTSRAQAFQKGNLVGMQDVMRRDAMAEEVMWIKEST